MLIKFRISICFVKKIFLMRLFWIMVFFGLDFGCYLNKNIRLYIGLKLEINFLKI